MAQNSCIGVYATRCRRNKANPDNLEIEVCVGSCLLHNNSNKKQTLPASPRLFFSEPRRAFLSPDRKDQHTILSTIIGAIHTPFPLQDIHWTVNNFPKEGDGTNTLDEIIANRLIDVARSCASDDRITSMVIFLTQLEKVDEFPERGSKELLEEHLGNWLRENPGIEAQAAVKCLEGIYEGRTLMENQYHAVRSGKITKEQAGEKCSVCLGGFVEGKQEIAMPCSHIFHGFCILKWLEQAPNCPFCRCKL